MTPNSMPLDALLGYISTSGQDSLLEILDHTLQALIEAEAAVPTIDQVRPSPLCQPLGPSGRAQGANRCTDVSSVKRDSPAGLKRRSPTARPASRPGGPANLRQRAPRGLR